MSTVESPPDVEGLESVEDEPEFDPRPPVCHVVARVAHRARADALPVLGGWALCGARNHRGGPATTEHWIGGVCLDCGLATCPDCESLYREMGGHL